MTSANALLKIAESGAGTALATEHLAAALANNALGSGVALPGAGGVQYAKFDGNTGKLVFGKENSPVADGQVFIVPIPSLKHGWLFWQASRSEKNTAISVSAALPMPNKPDDRPLVGGYPKPNERDGWQMTWELELVGHGDLLDGITLSLPLTSTGGQQFWSSIASAIVNRVRAGGHDGCIHPILTIKVDDYFHDKYKRTVYVPRAIFEGWTDGNRIVAANPHDNAPGAAQAAAPAVADPFA